VSFKGASNPFLPSSIISFVAGTSNPTIGNLAFKASKKMRPNHSEIEGKNMRSELIK